MMRLAILSCLAVLAASEAYAGPSWEIGNGTPTSIYFVQGQGFTPSVLGNVGAGTPAAGPDGNVYLETFSFDFASAAIPNTLAIYDFEPTLAAAATGAGSLAMGTHTGGGTYDFTSGGSAPGLLLPFNALRFAVLPAPTNIHDGSGNTYTGGRDMYEIGGLVRQPTLPNNAEEFDNGFRATFAPTPSTIPDIVPQTELEFVGGATGWGSTYDIGFDSGALTIDLNIKLTGFDPGDALRDVWKQGIEGIWSDAFDITDGTSTFPIQVNVNWVTSGFHYKVAVSEGTGHPTMLHWYTDDPGGWGNEYQDETAAHEAGHMMGLFDEYPEGTLDPDTLFTTTNSIMADLGLPRPWHFERILQWLEGQVNVNLSLAGSPLPPYPQDPPIVGFGDRHPLTPAPEPGTWSLALVGLSLIGWRARHTVSRPLRRPSGATPGAPGGDAPRTRT